MLFRDTTDVYYENRRIHTNTLCGQNVEFSTLNRVVHVEPLGFKWVNLYILPTTRSVVYFRALSVFHIRNKELERICKKVAWPNRGTIRLSFAWRDWGKRRKPSVGIDDVQFTSIMCWCNIIPTCSLPEPGMHSASPSRTRVTTRARRRTSVTRAKWNYVSQSSVKKTVIITAFEIKSRRVMRG
jgi:hypothetical protein